MFNLLMMMMCWASTNFCFYLTNYFVKYMPGDVYVNQMIIGFAEVINLAQGPLAALFNNKRFLCISFLLGLLGAIAISFFETGTSHIIIYSLVLLAMRFGISLSYAQVYVIHPDLFPS